MELLFDPDADLKQKLILNIKCRNLPNLDKESNTDPFVVLYSLTPDGQIDAEIGRTEVVKDSLNPEFVQHFTIDYFFEEIQHFRFDLYDCDDANQITNLKA